MLHREGLSATYLDNQMHFKIIFKKLEYMNAWYEHKLAMPEEQKYERITTDL